MDIITLLKQRYDQTPSYHPNVVWDEIQPLLQNHLQSFIYLEETGGEIHIISYQDHILVVDLSKETPKRRSLCYDKQARISRKKFPPETSALEECEAHHVSLVDEDLYRYLNTLKWLDDKTSSWLLTPEHIRNQGGALFGSSSYERVFVYHNTAPCYYESRSFRAYITLK